MRRGAEYFLVIYFNEAFSSVEPVAEKPEASVTAKPQEESDTCRGLAPLFLKVVSFVIVRAVRALDSLWLCLPSRYYCTL